MEKFNAQGEDRRDSRESNAESPTLDEARVRKVFTDGLTMEASYEKDDFLDKAYERYESLMQDQNLNGADQRLVLNVFWSLAKDFLKISDDVEFPDSLKEKLISDRGWLMKFVRYIQSWEIDMREIEKWKEKMSPEEEKFFWQIFHRKFNVRSNRGFEEFPEQYKKIISGIIETGVENYPERPVSVLDVGCGPKAKAIRDLKEKYKGKIDAFGINMEIYDMSSPDVFLKEGDARNMPFDKDMFDLAYEIGVAGYFRTNDRDLADFITDAMRVLKPGGKLLLTDARPDLNFLDSLGIGYKIIQQDPLVIEKK